MAARGGAARRVCALALALAAALAGCNVGPDFVPPDPGLPNGSFSARGGARRSLTPEPDVVEGVSRSGADRA